MENTLKDNALKVKYFQYKIGIVEVKEVASIKAIITRNAKAKEYRELPYFLSINVCNRQQEKFYANHIIDFVEGEEGIKLIGSEFNKDDTRKILHYVIDHAECINMDELMKEAPVFKGSEKMQ